MKDTFTGYVVVLGKKGGGEFVAHVDQGSLPGDRAFYSKFREAQAANRELREHGFKGRVTKAVVTVEWQVTTGIQERGIK